MTVGGRIRAILRILIQTIMKHIFVVNTYAGKATAREQITEMLKTFEAEYEIFFTSAPGDATSFVKNRCENDSSGDTLRFYACGGDGTVKEVVCGLVGYRNVELTVVPLGSGNDFVKYYGGSEAFLDLNKLKDAPSDYIDLIKVNGEYCINVCNFGFESYVAKTMHEVRHKKLIGGKFAYTTGIVKALIFAMKNKADIYVDGEKIIDGNYLLCTVANGRFVGGGYMCAPKSFDNDGLLEVCAVKVVSRLFIVRLINVYKAGKHLDDERFANIVVYRRGKKIEVRSPSEITISLDGELVTTNNFVCEVVPSAIKFAALAMSVGESADTAEVLAF